MLFIIVEWTVTSISSVPLILYVCFLKCGAGGRLCSGHSLFCLPALAGKQAPYVVDTAAYTVLVGTLAM